MDTKGLLFIPDISGFTRFVSHTEIEHSRLIIQELLEVLINANKIGLEVSEIEGDAILFYKFGERPTLEEIYKQVEEMFCAFHKNLLAYDAGKYCQCKACLSAAGLTLKVISHYGEFTGYTVQNFHKLIGKDIIVAHQLLKNDIPQHEYWLVTNKLLPSTDPVELAQWMQWNSSAKQTETGEVEFHFTQLAPLKEHLAVEPPQQPDLTHKTKLITASREYDTDLITLFHATGDFSYRAEWQEDVIKTEELNHFLPRVGMRYRSIKKNGESAIYTSSYYSYSEERIEFTEADENNKTLRRYILEKIAKNKSRFTLEHYVERGLFTSLVFSLTKKKAMEESIKHSLAQLEPVINKIKL